METYKKALSIRQPWAWLIANGFKDIENRKWSTNLREEIFIHASKTITRKDYQDCSDFVYNIDKTIIIPHLKELDYGGIVGAATITACVQESQSPWFVGKWGFIFERPRVLPFQACLGTLQFFYPSY